MSIINAPIGLDGDYPPDRSVNKRILYTFLSDYYGAKSK